jgi:hypothetical protein
MASRMTSPTRTKKVVRRASKSPRRNYSPSRAQPEIQFESEESAYSDPIDSSRTLRKFIK